MKKSMFCIIAVLFAAMMLCCCSKESGSSAPKISVEDPTKPYSDKKGTYNVSYGIENPRKGVELELYSENGWITNLSADDGAIEFTLSANNSPKLRRGEIELAYEGAESVIVIIRQSGFSHELLDKDGTSNCYIISKSGTYQFAAVKGNSKTPVGAVSSAEVLWESFGTDTAPEKGELVEEVSCNDEANVMVVKTARDFRKGNAVIAAKDKSGKILWSWHLWFTDRPEDQVYNNEAGTMMDRNLGATSAVPGEIETLGLLYQWGRKDPFPGSSTNAAVSFENVAKTTIDPWPDIVKSDATTGTLNYAIANPTTFIGMNENNGDWYYFDAYVTDCTRWRSEKTVYDPCPPGYRVPDDGIWSKAFGITEPFIKDAVSGRGYDFGSSSASVNKLTASPVCWYPFIGGIADDISKRAKANISSCWSCSMKNTRVSTFFLEEHRDIYQEIQRIPAFGFPVRCQKE